MSEAERAGDAAEKMLAQFRKYSDSIIKPEELETSYLDRVNAATELRDLLSRAVEVQRLSHEQQRDLEQGETTDEV